MLTVAVIVNVHLLHYKIPMVQFGAVHVPEGVALTNV
jgi:hypothetical protein